jgi:hypothetical protein
MRLWSLHPKYLDARGLTACWREGLLARKVLLGETRGYRDHPQLERFRAGGDPVALVDTYLRAIWREASSRGYSFDASKIGPRFSRAVLEVKAGQVAYEFEWLKTKLAARDPDRSKSIGTLLVPETHPLFRVVPGEIEAWERIK